VYKRQQYNQLIARRVREQGVYCDLVPFTTSIEKIREYAPIGIVFTGGPNSVYEAGAPDVDAEIFELGIPVLGICYGCQLVAHKLGGKVAHAETREYGKSEIEYTESLLFKGIDKNNICWMSHTDYVGEVPSGFHITATTKTCPAAGFEDAEKKIYGIQFHPEVHHTVQGDKILRNFLYEICGAKGDWTMSNFVSEQVAQLKKKLAGKKVLCAMSGGVDSAVAATLVHRAAGDNLTCVFVDHGLLRKGESEEVVSVFRDKLGMNLIRADASERFLKKLKGVADPERKRKIIGEEFIGEDSVCLVLGDNIFHGAGFTGLLREAVRRSEEEHTATVFGYWVDDPERYGVAEFDKSGNCLSIEEKPQHPKSNYAVVGLYFYPNEVVEVAKSIRPSSRGELEITTVNQRFLSDGKLKVQTLGRGFAWLDTGTHDSLSEASTFIEVIEKRQGLKIACLEGIAYRQGWITAEKLREVAAPMLKNQYGQYLLKVIGEVERTGEANL